MISSDVSQYLFFRIYSNNFIQTAQFEKRAFMPCAIVDSPPVLDDLPGHQAKADLLQLS